MQRADSESDPLVSVIVPIFNAERFLAETIESVRSQTYQSWELLLVDDGSTDGSAAIAQQYARLDPGRIRCLEHPGHANRGENPSRKHGLMHARGDFVALLDADDIWFPNKLEEQVALLRSHPDAGMLYGRTEYWYSWTGRPEDVKRDRTPPMGASGRYRPLELVGPYLDQRIAVPCTCTILARRQSLLNIGAFDDVFANHGDQTFYMRMMMAEPVVVVEKCWDRYRQHDASVSAELAKSRERKRQGRLAFLEWLGEQLRRNGVSDPGIWAALRRAQRRMKYARIHAVLSALRRKYQSLSGPFTPRADRD